MLERGNPLKILLRTVIIIAVLSAIGIYFSITDDNNQPDVLVENGDHPKK
ncbi:hypothetical protein AAHB53_04200 [Niallia circulans]